MCSFFPKGAEISDDDLFDYIADNKNMSKSLEEYGGGRSTAITCAKRLALFLGDNILKGGSKKSYFVFVCPLFKKNSPLEAIRVI